MALSDHPCPRDPSNAAHHVLRYRPFILALIPPLYLITMVLTQTVDVPFADQWALVPLLAHAYQGTLSLQDLWAQHNEHRLLFPRLVMLGLARLSRWNTQAEMLANTAPLAPLPWARLVCPQYRALNQPGRVSYGNHQALAQGYATSATLFWIALVILLALYAHLHTNRVLIRASTAVMLGYVLLTTLSTLQGPGHFRWQQEFLTPARNELFTLQNDALLQQLYFDPHAVKQGVTVLKQYQLSVFR